MENISCVFEYKNARNSPAFLKRNLRRTHYFNNMRASIILESILTIMLSTELKSTRIIPANEGYTIVFKNYWSYSKFHKLVSYYTLADKHIHKCHFYTVKNQYGATLEFPLLTGNRSDIPRDITNKNLSQTLLKYLSTYLGYMMLDKKVLKSIKMTNGMIRLMGDVSNKQFRNYCLKSIKPINRSMLNRLL